MYNINGLSFDPKTNPEWFTRAAFGGKLVSGGYIGILTGIKGDEKLSTIALENKVLQADGLDCAWTPNQIIKLSEKTAKIKTYKINLEQCLDTLEKKRTAYMLSPGAKNESLPADLENATLALLAMELSNEIEEMIVAGDEEKDPNQFDGFVKTLLDSPDSIQLKGALITQANALSAVQAVYNAFPERVLRNEKIGTLFILCSYTTLRNICNALEGVNNQTVTMGWTINTSDPKNPRVYRWGVEVVPVIGLDNSTLIGYDSNNAYLTTDMTSDLENIRLGNFPAPKDNVIFIDGRMRLGFVTLFDDEIVIWSASVTTDRPAQTDPLQIAPNSLVFSAAGETKTFTVTTPSGVTPTFGASPEGFTVTPGETTSGLTTVTVVAAAYNGIRPRVGQITVSLPDTDRSATVTLNQTNEDIVNVTP